jgi:iron complex outermembrane receptor protein
MQQKVVVRRLQLVVAIGAVLAALPVAAQSGQTGQAPPAEQQARQDEPGELDLIEVVGVRAAIFTARAEERDNDVVTNVVTADDAGQFADQNVAESLQRVPGLSIDRDAGEGRRINVRGLGPQFNPVTINGVVLATSDLDRDAVVDVLPNDLLGTLTVTKTLTPDMNADAIGGAVDLRAIDPFSRDNGGSLRAEAGRADYAGGGIDPKLSGSYNRTFDTASGGRFGLSLSASYSQRDLAGDILRNRDVPRYSRIGADCNQNAPEAGCVLRSVRVENRVDRSERTRYGLAANFDWKPNANQEYFLRLIGSRYRLDDERYVDRWQMGPTRATALGPGSGSFQGGTDVELRKQITFVEREETTTLAHLGGRTTTDNWVFDYGVAGSRNRLDIPDQLTGRFRIRNIGIDYTQTEDDIDISARRRGTTFPDPNNPAAYAFDQLTRVEENREDTIVQGNIDARRDFDWNGRAAFLKFGVKAQRRDKDADREEVSGTPAAGTTLALLGLQNLDTNIANFGFQPNSADARRLFDASRGVLLPATNGNSANQDYTVDEDIDSAYLMGSLELSESFSVFGGVRLESTDWRTSGFQLETIDPLVGANIDSVRAISRVTTGYTDALPSVHMRWEPRQNIVIRGSLSSAIVRPNFDEASATRTISTREITAGVYNRTFSGGNPLLDPLRAKQADLSIAWYPSENTFLYAGLFYKRIDDFYIQGQLIGSDVARIGLPVGNGTINGGFDTANVFLNGNRATVSGVELVYEQAFVALPGWWSGLFVSGNVTLVDSEADYGPVFNNRKAALPDQADRIANLSLGWENERFTFRVSGNYRDEQLDVINANPVFDQSLTDYLSVDLNVRWNINDRLQLYFDGSNLNDEKDVTVWRGDATSGGAFAADEGGIIDFGPSYAVGLRFKF